MIAGFGPGMRRMSSVPGAQSGDLRERVTLSAAPAVHCAKDGS